jgi:hypothetical protein
MVHILHLLNTVVRKYQRLLKNHLLKSADQEKSNLNKYKQRNLNENLNYNYWKHATPKTLSMIVNYTTTVYTTGQ